MKSKAMRWKEKGIEIFLFSCALLSIVTTAGIVWTLSTESIAFFREVSPFEFFFGTRWAPLLEPRSFGILPLVCGTFLVAAGALAVALPIGLGTGIYLSEYAKPRIRGCLKPILEVLAGIPTVVYGYFALTFITPHILRPLIPQTEVFNAANAALVVGVMIIRNRSRARNPEKQGVSFNGNAKKPRKRPRRFVQTAVFRALSPISPRERLPG